MENNYAMPAATVGPDEEQGVRAMSPSRIPRKRKRTVISCGECHRRKQKCDRAYPCSNCVARSKEALCHYENEDARKQQLLEESNNISSENGFGVVRLGSDSVTAVSAFGYAKSSGNNNTTTLGIFNKIKSHDVGETMGTVHQAFNCGDQSALRENFRIQIRQLPQKDLMEKLLVTYFREVNYHYYPLDEGLFRDLLNSWKNILYPTLKQAPISLPPDLQFFPALLFQALALALQFQPPDYDPSLDSLKVAKEMSFDDLASEYSGAGDEILKMLGKRNTTLITVQAGFLRTAYLKNCGLVPESWYSLSDTVRDAQEIGLHKNSHDRSHMKPDASPEDELENLWMVQLRRRMWTILANWDVHMAILLGRPTTIDPRDERPIFPIDAPIPKNRREVAPAKRTESDPPTPLTMLLWSAETSAPLLDIFNLEKEDPHQNNFAKVEKMHSLIKQVSLHTPAYFRAENPDTTFDSHPDCYWLPRARPTFQNSAAFTVMALHRPYIFTNPVSRTRALKAGLDILRAQRAIFNLINIKDYKFFALVLNTFDAIVLVAAIYILHPHENDDDLASTLQHFEWGMERFQKMGGRNAMATSALGVLKAIHVRLKKALKFNSVPTKTLPPVIQSTPAIPTPPDLYSSSVRSFATPHDSISSTSSTTVKNEPKHTQPAVFNITGSVGSGDPIRGSLPSNWDPNLQNFDFSSMTPLQPMHDLIYNQLYTIGGDPQMIDPALTGMNTDAMGLVDASNDAYQFGGNFDNDSFWGFMNNYNPT